MAALLCAGAVHAHGRLVELSVYDRTEGRRFPQFKGLGWLNIVMPVDHEVGPSAFCAGL